MKKTLFNIHILFIIILSALIFSCSNPENEGFNPKKGSDISTTNDLDYEKLLAEKKAKFDAAQGSNIAQQILQFDGKVKLTIMLPNDKGLSETEMKLLEGKLMKMVTTNGIGGIGGNPRFIIAPVVNILKKDATSTAPIKYSIKYDVNFYVADILTGSVYGSYGMKFSCVESSEARAFISGFENLDASDIGFQEFLKNAQEKIIKYYNENGDKIISEANSLSTQKKYAQAVSLLESIPMEASVAYKNASKITPQIFQKYLNNKCEIVLAMMKSSLGTYNEKSAAGYNEEAMGYYKMIPNDGKCKKEADALYIGYKKGLNPQNIKDWEKADKEWQLKVSQQNSDNSYRALQEEMKAKIAVEGNICLLDKYKKDAAYDNLPWLRKLIHLGDYDPFDGNKPNKDCN